MKQFWDKKQFQTVTSGVRLRLQWLQKVSNTYNDISCILSLPERDLWWLFMGNMSSWGAKNSIRKYVRERFNASFEASLLLMVYPIATITGPMIMMKIKKRTSLMEKLVKSHWKYRQMRWQISNKDDCKAITMIWKAQTRTWIAKKFEVSTKMTAGEQ